jgi:hypothetical protein
MNAASKGIAKFRSKDVPVRFYGDQPYLEVATKVALAHEDGGFSEVYHEFISVGDKTACKIGVEVKGKVFFGTAQVKFGGKAADASDPIENAETSALGRALAAAGYEIGAMASAEDMAHVTVESEAPRQLPVRTQPAPVTMKALPEPKDKVPSIPAQCRILANHLKYSDDAWADLCQQHAVNGKVNFDAMKAQLMKEEKAAS